MSTKLFSHYTRNENLIIKSEPRKHGFKPRGLWLASGDDWLKACNDMGMGCGEYKYEILVDMKDIIVIDSVIKLIEFTKTYKSDWFLIDWEKVFSTYKGIYIDNYDMIKSYISMDAIGNFEYSWFFACDISSCCIVDTTCILSCSKGIYKPHEYSSSDE